jgi:UDP-N-acetyl-D-glucosamine dehydrogenase
MRHYPDMPAMRSVELTAKSLGSYDCVLISTHHKAYDWQFIADHAKLIVDSRNALGKIAKPRAHVVKA